MSTKLPPQNVEAEESVLGALMIDKDAMHKIADVLTPADFYKPTHSTVYRVILKLHEKQQPIDVLTVTSELKGENTLEAVGGSSYLAHLMDSVPTSSHIEHYAKLVKEKKILRDLIRTSSEITENAFSPSEDIEQVLDDIEQKIFSISQRSITQKFTAISSDLPIAKERIARLNSDGRQLRGVATGFTAIDNMLSGLQKSDLIILGARPSLGKTSLALDIMRHVAIRENKAVGFFSLEMAREQVVDRIIAAEAAVPLWKLRSGKKLSDTDFDLIQHTLEKLSTAPIYIDDTPSPNILQMRAMGRRLISEHKELGLIVVDYLQLIQPRTNSDNLVAQITEISRGLKGLARELNVPVIALSQLSRASDQREVKMPRLSDLRDSGSIEQDADIVFFIYRKDRDKVGLDPQDENVAEIIIAKHRNGPVGSVKLKFDAEVASFKTIDNQHNYQGEN